MKIAYGIHGYGRGHATRALAVLPELARRHDVLILAGGDAWRALADDYRVVRIPTLRYSLGRGGRISAARTLVRTVPRWMDLNLRGPALEMVTDVVGEFAPDVVVSDSEAWTHRAAKRLGIGRISFDHYGVLAYCAWPMSAGARVRCRIEARLYRALMGGHPDRVVIASFYAPPARRAGVRVVGPVLRDAVAQATPSDGPNLLVYFSNGHVHFTPRVEAALRALDVPVTVYGVGRAGRDGTLDFRPPDNERFVADLAACGAVFATAGNQLISEAMHLRKPMLLLPEDSFEQRLNAAAVERMGIGMRTSRKTVCVDQLRAFQAARDRLAAAMPAEASDGRARAVEAIERYAAELTGQT